ncbi:hypothetical protein CEUSTIGMA_g4031.t1 [Chlamydomonas eustigma]|uniref:Trafficking protein particle complex subunit n=1 Tax=Chlamydomonas eustigma TaxID=1157962 RepID=A0A250X0L3_9CHLO|nr:hypothetical protein CEUSTIGMA_g4031.t1 [Chlamydomonas eustigma]|eukprot:GAX76585.1 hypothetical protein CEUSTIGMA_g4031.t1 [Chlamydomonas eustigma]
MHARMQGLSIQPQHQGGNVSQTTFNPKKRCADVCMELLLLESVHLYKNRGAPAASAALEAIGMRVGKQLAERYTKDRPRLGETLEVIKFLCKDFWLLVFKKQVDNLRTNHKGVYVLTDNNFRWLSRSPPISSAGGDPSQEEALREVALQHLHLPCGILRGAMIQLGVPCTVEADHKLSPPACAFTIRLS